MSAEHTTRPHEPERPKTPAAPQPAAPLAAPEAGFAPPARGLTAAGSSPIPPNTPAGTHPLPHLDAFMMEDSLLAMQETQGNQFVQRAVVQHAMVQRLAVQRENPPPDNQPANQPGGAPNNADPDAARKQLEEDEKKAYDAAKGKVGAVAAKVEFESRKGQDEKEIDADEYTISAFVEKPASYPDKRVGFDNPGQASAWASTNAGGSGTVVVQQDKFYFVAKITGGRSLRAKQPTIGEADWWKLKSFYVYRVTPQSGVTSVYSIEGMSFPLNTTIQPSVGSAEQLPDPTKEQAQPPNAGDMRKMAGIPDDPTPENPHPKQETDKYGHPKGQIDIPNGTEETFINNYFRARAMEMLSQNESQVDKLAEQFKPQKPPPGADGKESPAGIGPAAKALIDASRKAGEKYKQILDNEMRLATQLNQVENHPVGDEVTIGSETKYVWQWRDDLRDKYKKEMAQKNEILSQSPMLAMLVPDKPPPSQMQQDFKDLEKKGSWLGGAGGATPISDIYNWMKGTRKEGENPYDESVLAKKAPEGDAKAQKDLDEQVASDFRKKLDAVKQALQRAKAGTVGGDLDLLGMSALRGRVKNDLDNIKGSNRWLPTVLDRMLAEHASSDLKWTILETVIQVGLIFVPGVGQLLSAVMGFALQAKEMDKHLKEWDVSKAAVDPATALVDQQKAQEALLDDTLMLAVTAADVATSVNHSLTAMEKGGKEMPKGKKADEATEPAGPQAKPVTPVEPGKPPKLEPWKAEEVSKDILVHFQGLGINVKTRQMSAKAVLDASGHNWEVVKKNLLDIVGATANDKAAGQYFMQQMVEYRSSTNKAIFDDVISRISAEKKIPKDAWNVEAVGSTKLTSDMDYSVTGPYANEVVADFNAQFRQRMSGEAGQVFDTNVYTGSAHLEYPIQPHDPHSPIPMEKYNPDKPTSGGVEAWADFEKQTLGKAKSADETKRMQGVLKDAERLYPNDLGARLRYVNNFNQDVASHMAAADQFLSEGPAGIEKWQAYQKKVLDAAPAEKHAQLQSVFKEAEARVQNYQKEVIAKLEELNPGQHFTPEDLAKMAHNSADPKQAELYKQYLTARNRLYETKLTELETLKQAYKDAASEAERMEIAAKINAMQSESLYFASEAYQTSGSILSVVQNAQKAKKNIYDPAFGAMMASQSRAAFFEQYGKAMSYKADLEGTVKAGKYTERAADAVMAHPNATAVGMPGSIGTLKQLDKLKQAGAAEADIVKMLNGAGYAGNDLPTALSAFHGQLAADRDMLLKQMTQASGLPLPDSAEAWEKLAQSKGMSPEQLLLKCASALNTARTDG